MLDMLLTSEPMLVKHSEATPPPGEPGEVGNTTADRNALKNRETGMSSFETLKSRTKN